MEIYNTLYLINNLRTNKLKVRDKESSLLRSRYTIIDRFPNLTKDN